jgi:ABC-type antimicrobial peptide transport system ATPase subunit
MGTGQAQGQCLPRLTICRKQKTKTDSAFADVDSANRTAVMDLGTELTANVDLQSYRY